VGEQVVIERRFNGPRTRAKAATCAVRLPSGSTHRLRPYRCADRHHSGDPSRFTEVSKGPLRCSRVKRSWPTAARRQALLKKLCVGKWIEAVVAIVDDRDRVAICGCASTRRSSCPATRLGSDYVVDVSLSWLGRAGPQKSMSSSLTRSASSWWTQCDASGSLRRHRG
jgi:hypothetical protein